MSWAVVWFARAAVDVVVGERWSVAAVVAVVVAVAGDTSGRICVGVDDGLLGMIFGVGSETGCLIWVDESFGRRCLSTQYLRTCWVGKSCYGSAAGRW